MKLKTIPANVGRESMRRGHRLVSLSVLFCVALLPVLADDAGPSPLDDLEALIKQGRYADAEQGARDLLAQVESELGADSIEAARVLDLLVEASWRGGKSRKPETLDLARRALAIKENGLGADHAEVAESLNNLAVVYYFLGAYDEAQPLWERALAIRKRTLGPEDPEVAQALNNLANLMQTTGDYATARALYAQSLEIREKAFGPENPLVAQSLHNLALLLKNMGDYAAALPLAERALEIKQKGLGPEHPKVATSLDAVGSILWLTGDYDRALPLLERSLAILEKALGPEHPLFGAGLNNLAEQLRNVGKYDEARPLYERALSIWEQAYGPDNPRVAVCLSSLASLLEETGDIAGAIERQQRAASIREMSLSPNHPALASSLSSLGILRTKSGDYEEARTLLERAVAIRRESLGPEHPYVAESLNALATLAALTGRTPEALALAIEAETIARDHLRLTCRSLSEQHALHYAAVRSSGLELALTLTGKGLDASSNRRVLDTLVRSRAVVLDEMAARNRAVWVAADAEVAQLADRLSSARDRLANLTVRGLGNMDPERYREMLDAAREEKEKAERALAGASVAFARERQRSRLGVDDVASSLPDGSALVAFALYEPVDLSKPAAVSEPAYVALVHRAGERSTKVISLGAARQIDDSIMKWKRETVRGLMRSGDDGQEAEAAYRRAGEALRRRIWDPLTSAIGEARRVFVVPDGSLNLVSVAALPVAEERYLIENGPVLHYLSAERDLVPGLEAGVRGEGLLALGNPDFERAAASVSVKKPRIEPAGSGDPAILLASSVSEEGPALRATRSGCRGFDEIRFEPLPATAQEIQQVVGLWRESGGTETSGPGKLLHLTGPAASEAAFKNGAAGRQVLHLATHGFFLGGDCVSSTRSRGIGGLSALESTPPVQLEAVNPLLLSGLALAGANRRESTSSTEEDGVLTAEELSALDLSGVEWAVLSACDTGVGEIRAGEGVFGLRRAVQLAGVRTVIMSLWSVDDESTQRWMQTLYRGRLQQGLDTSRAVRAAGLDSLQRRREAGESTHPFYWGAFVAAGDWR
jgi:CHAT domain-containing protein/Tfp pilus assembly protein PilF